MQIEDIHKYGASAIGKKELIKHMKGKLLTAKETINAKCYECMNGYTDGKVDCLLTGCPLYSFMPYREGEKRVMRTMTDEQKAKVSMNLLGKKDLSPESITPAS